MISLKLSHDEIWTAINAMHTAADDYAVCAKTAKQSGHPSIETQFKSQEQRALALALKLEQA